MQTGAHRPDPARALMLQFLGWIAERPRSRSEVMEAWRSSCPRLTIWEDAIIETFLTLLATTPDTHIARRSGAEMAVDVSRQARAILVSGGVRSQAGKEAIERMDQALRDSRHLGNPGTTADLTTAAIFVALLDGAWRG